MQAKDIVEQAWEQTTELLGIVWDEGRELMQEIGYHEMAIDRAVHDIMVPSADIYEEILCLRADLERNKELLAERERLELLMGALGRIRDAWTEDDDDQDRDEYTVREEW